jgi:D-sedoheptulose 7-phosphate isomerase
MALTQLRKTIQFQRVAVPAGRPGAPQEAQPPDFLLAYARGFELHRGRHGPCARKGQDMGGSKQQAVSDHFHRSCEALERAARDPELATAILAIAEAIADAFRNGGKVLIAGNGGSAADAQHIAGEMLSRMNFDRSPLPAIALTTDTSVLTAVGNDYGFDRVFERQVRGLGRRGDVFIAISTSGRSPNVMAALRAARDIGLVTIGFTGNGPREMSALCDLCLAAPASETPVIQQIHIVAAHAICGLVEDELFKAKTS